jgi:hypothetical protein
MESSKILVIGKKYPCPIRSGIPARFFDNIHTVYQRVLMPLQDEYMDSGWKRKRFEVEHLSLLDQDIPYLKGDLMLCY